MSKVVMKSGHIVECVSYKEVDGIIWVRTPDGYVYQLDANEVEYIEQ